MNAVSARFVELYGFAMSSRGFREFFNSRAARFEFMPSIKKPSPSAALFALMASTTALLFILAAAAFVSNHTWNLGLSLLGGAGGLIIVSAFFAALFFIYYAADILVLSSFVFLYYYYNIADTIIYYISSPPLISLDGILLFSVFFLFPAVLLLPLLPMLFVGALGTIRHDKDRQAHMLFVASMVALGGALWLQSGGHWQQMAVLDSPVEIPGLFTIPFTASISFPFALLGWVENSAGSALSFASAASTNEILALFASAAVLFFFALNWIQLSAVGVRPEFALLAFALFWVSVFFDVALHWSGAPVLPPVLILFNRAFAVLALLWLATQLSHANLSPVAFYWVKCAMISVFVAMPLRLMIQFKLDFQKALGRYNQLLALWQQSYKPPPTVATDEQVRDALNGGRGIGGKDWNDTGE